MIFLADHNRDIISLRYGGGNTGETCERDRNQNDSQFSVHA
jgi:hypothetical protein